VYCTVSYFTVLSWAVLSFTVLYCSVQFKTGLRSLWTATQSAASTPSSPSLALAAASLLALPAVTTQIQLALDTLPPGQVSDVISGTADVIQAILGPCASGCVHQEWALASAGAPSGVPSNVTVQGGTPGNVPLAATVQGVRSGSITSATVQGGTPNSLPSNASVQGATQEILKGKDPLCRGCEALLGALAAVSAVTAGAAHLTAGNARSVNSAACRLAALTQPFLSGFASSQRQTQTQTAGDQNLGTPSRRSRKGKGKENKRDPGSLRVNGDGGEEGCNTLGGPGGREKLGYTDGAPRSCCSEGPVGSADAAPAVHRLCTGGRRHPPWGTSSLLRVPFSLAHRRRWVHQGGRQGRRERWRWCWGEGMGGGGVREGQGQGVGKCV